VEFIRITITQGFIFGSIYALAAIGFALLYNTTGIFHIVYGDLAILGFTIVVTINTTENALPLVSSLGVAILVVWILTGLIFGGYKLLERRGADRMALFVASLGLSFGLEALMILVFGPNIRTFFIPDLLRTHDIATFSLSILALITVGSAFLIFALVMLALRKTRWGYRVRGIAANPELSQLVGIRITRTMWGVYGVAALCSVWAATLLGMFTTQTSASGISLFLIAAIAVIAAGRGTYAGGFLLAMALGFVTPIFEFYISETWASSAVFGFALVLLLLRPSGLSRASIGAQR